MTAAITGPLQTTGTAPRKPAFKGLGPDATSFLEMQFPPEQIKHDMRRATDGFEPYYVEASNIIQRLNDVFGSLWNFEILEHIFLPPGQSPTQVVVRGQLTIPAGEISSPMVKQQYGSCFVKLANTGGFIDLGSDMKAAATDALKKCATMLGIALNLYQRDETPNQGLTRVGGGRPEQGSFPQMQADPNAPAQEFQIQSVRQMFQKLGVPDGAWQQQLGFNTPADIKVGHVNQLLSGQHPWVQQLSQQTGVKPGLTASAA